LLNFLQINLNLIFFRKDITFRIVFISNIKYIAILLLR